MSEDKPIPQDIVDAFTRVMDLESTFPITSGWYDRPRGANMSMGKGWAKVLRLIAAHGLNETMVLSSLAGSYLTPGQRSK